MWKSSRPAGQEYQHSCNELCQQDASSYWQRRLSTSAIVAASCTLDRGRDRTLRCGKQYRRAGVECTVLSGAQDLAAQVVPTRWTGSFCRVPCYWSNHAPNVKGQKETVYLQERIVHKDEDEVYPTSLEAIEPFSLKTFK
jgi:hypothetical protein